MKSEFILFLTFTLCYSANKVLIMTHHYKRTDFIELQYKTLKKFLKDPHELVVFNDAPSNSLSKQIDQICKKFNIRCIRIPQEIHNKPYLKRESTYEYNHPCVRCANVVQYSLDVLGFKHPGLACIIDSDMFLIRDFSIADYMKNYDIGGVGQARHNEKGHVFYLWNGLLFFNMKTLPNKHEINFNCGKVENVSVDVGGYTHHYLKKYTNLKRKDITISHINFIPKSLSSLKKRFSSKEIDFLIQKPDNIEFLCNDHILHYRGGQNWDYKSPEYHRLKMVQFTQFIENIIK